MAEAVEISEGKLGGALVVEDDVGDAGERDVSGDRDGGLGGGGLEMSVDGEDAFDAAGLEEARIFGYQVFAVAMVGGEEEVALLHEDFAGSAQYLRVIA